FAPRNIDHRRSPLFSVGERLDSRQGKRKGAVVSKALLVLGTLLFFGWSVEGCSSGGGKHKPDSGAPDGSVEGDGATENPDKPDATSKPDSGGGSKNDCGTCPKGATCDKSGSSPKCVCDKGYELNGKSGSDAACVDINECDSKNDCGSHATCKNTDGSYECS